MEPFFGHEKLLVYQKAIEFAAWANKILGDLPKNISAHDQLDRSSTSIAINIAEGNGKWQPKDRCRFFDISWGSALEAAAVLYILGAKQKLNKDQIIVGKKILSEIVRMLVGLIKVNDPDRGFGADGWNDNGRIREEVATFEE